jgi:plasmid stabilization system protein ParE
MESARVRVGQIEEAAPGAADLIVNAVSVLARHPLIGRSIEHGLRELVISLGKTGYIALYRFRQAQDQVVVLAVRHQREAPP